MAAGVQARVLIVARDDVLAGTLADGLDRLGWRTVTARGPYAAVASRYSDASRGTRTFSSSSSTWA